MILLVCRPTQLREAAAVLACAPAGSPLPLLVLEPPPTDEGTYRRLHGAYRELRDRRDAVLGAALGQAAFRAGASPALPSNEDIDRALSMLTPYRSWVRHYEALRRSFAEYRFTQMILLFEASDAERTSLDPTPIDRMTDERRALLPDAERRVLLLADPNDPAAFTEQAWRLFLSDRFPAEKALVVADPSAPTHLSTLARARAARVPLIPCLRAADETISFREPCIVDALLPQATTAAHESEAVIIETDAIGHAEMLLAVAYVERQQARLILTPIPDTAPIERARLQIEALRQTRSKGVLENLKNFFNADDAQFVLRQLERAVTDAVPQTVIDAVGDRALTAMTIGVPYSFVRSASHDWSRKPIGHLAADPAVILTSDLFALPTLAQRLDVGFSLLFDPGFFQTDEGQRVLTELQGRVSLPVALTGAASASFSLQHLATQLPIEILFFNTHGSDRAILFSDLLLTGEKLLQRVRFASTPIVFNNSCESWIGVGQAFVRAGAGGYIGTLWSIDAQQAAVFAQATMRSLIHDDRTTVAAALHTSQIDPLTQRAYLFVGTASMRLSPPNEVSDATKSQRLLVASQILLQALGTWYEQMGENALPVTDALAQQLFTVVLATLATYDAQSIPLCNERLEVLLSQLQILVTAVLRRRAAPSTVLTLATQGMQMVNELASPPVDADITIKRYCARLFLRLGPVHQAVTLLNESIALAAERQLFAGPQQLELSDALKALGNFSGARSAAERAYAAYSELPVTAPATSKSQSISSWLRIMQPMESLVTDDEIVHVRQDERERHRGMQLALGRLAQACMRTGAYEDALKYAEEGMRASIASHDLVEQAIFSGDRTRALLKLDRVEDAVRSAHATLLHARRAHDDHLELSAHGMVVQASMRSGDLDAAFKDAEIGLAQAKRMGILSEVGDFWNDIASIHLARNEQVPALLALREAGCAFAQSGRPNDLAITLRKAYQTAKIDDTWEMAREMVAFEDTVIDSMAANVRRDLLDDAITRLVRAVTSDCYGTAAAIEQLESIVTIPEDTQRSPEGEILRRVLRLLRLWSSGSSSEWEKEATDIDQLLGQRYHLREILRGGPSRHRA